MIVRGEAILRKTDDGDPPIYSKMQIIFERKRKET